MSNGKSDCIISLIIFSSHYVCFKCRKSVSAYAKNHQLNNLVDVFLRKHPGKNSYVWWCVCLIIIILFIEKLKSESEQNEIKQEIARLTRVSA